ncbi:hypothetical protein TNCV_3147391 [Trichonephila clavipes]|nr:hypothetical protein TNCV_3147391 [Trichonephila clavipes]
MRPAKDLYAARQDSQKSALIRDFFPGPKPDYAGDPNVLSYATALETVIKVGMSSAPSQLSASLNVFSSAPPKRYIRRGRKEIPMPSKE